MQEATDILQTYFGYKHFRPMQAEVIQKVSRGEDALLLMPTGGGKSLCYQVPAIMMPGTTVVLSPLISLMKDQVDGLVANGVKAAYTNSSQTPAQQNAVEEKLLQGELDLLYVSPEKLVSQGFLPLLKRLQVNLFAIDEAHCISSWGHDFRPEYTRLGFLKQQFPQTPILALTATADRVTRHDILEQLSIPHAQTFVASFDRPNLRLKVLPGQLKFQQILDFLKSAPRQSGIIYCLSRKSTEQMTAKLLAKGFRAEAYHAGLDSRTRNRVQQNFSDDRTPIVCATVAFGMGIDKSNVRWVIHYNMPKNIESYYQEIGRAGRDGSPARCLLFYSYQDVRILHDMLSQSESDIRDLKLEKLQRMQQYAETAICRRRMLLNYFGETFSKDNCQNCDVCLNPPAYIDGTKLAQMALSAVYRLSEKVGMQMLIGVLRGSARRQILQRGYDKIKTYGVGRHHSEAAWSHYIRQLVNIGYLEIAYDQHNVIKLTESSPRVLFEGEQVNLVAFAVSPKTKKAPKEKRVEVPVASLLFEKLRQLRLQIARRDGLPPYRVFSDATLQEMATKQPLTYVEFSEISGVGEKKHKQFAERFLRVIRSFLQDRIRSGLRFKKATQLYTLSLFNNGLSPDEIANERRLVKSTIVTHLLYWSDGGEPIDFSPYLPKGLLDALMEKLPDLVEPVQLSELYQAFDEKWSYEVLRMGLAELRQRHYFSD